MLFWITNYPTIHSLLCWRQSQSVWRCSIHCPARSSIACNGKVTSSTVETPLPRLKLMATLVATRLVHFVLDTLSLQDSPWSDRQIVLHWVQSISLHLYNTVLVKWGHNILLPAGDTVLCLKTQPICQPENHVLIAEVFFPVVAWPIVAYHTRSMASVSTTSTLTLVHRSSYSNWICSTRTPRAFTASCLLRNTVPYSNFLL